jgi:hypothetical protein
MAQLIKSNGEVIEVKPAGKKFSLEEMQKNVGGYVEKFSIGNKHFLWNEEGLLDKLPENEKATKELFEACGRPVQTIVGDVLICESSEL